MEQLAPLLRRVNPKNPERTKIERARTKQRKQIRAQIETLDKEIVSVVCIYIPYKERRARERRKYLRDYQQERRFHKKTQYRETEE